MRFSNNKLLWILFIVIAFSAISTTSVLGQAAQGIKWLRVGSLHSWYSSFGAELETGRTGRGTEQLDGLRWNAQFSNQDCIAAKSMWIGTTNYEDRFLKITVPHKLVTVGTRFSDPIGEIIPTEFKMLGRFSSPTVIVDGDVATDNKLNDIVDEVVEDLQADRVIINKLNSYIGITTTRKIMAFSQKDHDNYFIYNYTFKNTGIIDNKGTIESKKLTDVYFFFQYRYGFGYEAFRCSGCGWSPSNNITWGRNVVNKQIGQKPTDSNFEMRAQYSWYGRHSQSDFASLGAPNFSGDGHMAAPQFVGTVTLHADKSTSDRSDDLEQPRTTHTVGSDTDPQSSDQFNPTLMTAKYEVMTRGHELPTHAEKIGSGFADLFGGDPGGFAQGQGFGPYTLEVGDSINIVLAEAVSGISREKSYEVGAKWKKGLNGELNTFKLPNGSTTSDADEYKDAWVMSGEDSLLSTFRNAISNYNNGFNIPSAPPPPNVFQVNSGGNKISLSWGNNAETWSNFQGYRVYRAIAKPDTFYTQVFQSEPGNPVNSWDDTEARRGFEYYYYITSYDDGSTNNGVSLESSKFYTITNKGAFLRKPAEESLSEIRVVPNPFHIQARTLQFGIDAGDRIAFLGLPAECEIKIFTERGDLIETIVHNDGSGDELWDSRTLSEQVIVSGVYIAYFEITKDIYNEEGKLILSKGNSIFRKFLVVR